MSKQTGTRAAKARAQKSGATPRQIKVQFTLDPESCTGKKFGLAVHHYSGGAPLAEDFSNAVARLIVTDWLDEAVTFPTLWLGGCSRPESEDVKLSLLDLVGAFGSDKVLKRGQLVRRLVNGRLCGYSTAMRSIMPPGHLAKHLETTAADSVRLKKGK
jgi:hypothetical protein